MVTSAVGAGFHFSQLSVEEVGRRGKNARSDQ
jgi:hypothetical protein